MERLTCVSVLLLLCVAGCATDRTVVLNDNGGWCWYQDERVIVHGDLLVLGSVANRSGTDGPQRQSISIRPLGWQAVARL